MEGATIALKTMKNSLWGIAWATSETSWSFVNEEGDTLNFNFDETAGDSPMLDLDNRQKQLYRKYKAKYDGGK